MHQTAHSMFRSRPILARLLRPAPASTAAAAAAATTCTRYLLLHRRSYASSSQCQSKTKGCHSSAPQPSPVPPTKLQFWSSGQTWRRAAVNTTRCLIGCTLGDFSSMWFLQAYYPDLGVGPIMAISMAAGVSTSMLLETVLLRMGRDNLSWPAAAQTAAGMSLISMLTMEMAQNVVDYHLTGGVVAFDSPAFWVAAVVSMGAGFLSPLPYNYLRLRKYGKSCH